MGRSITIMHVEKNMIERVGSASAVVYSAIRGIRIRLNVRVVSDSQLSRITGIPRSSVGDAIGRLIRSGDVVRVGKAPRGWAYYLPNADAPGEDSPPHRGESVTAQVTPSLPPSLSRLAALASALDALD